MKTRSFSDRPGETFILRYTYDQLSRPRTVTYPDGQVNEITYDAGGRPSSVTGVIDSVDYDPTGYVTRLAFTHGVETTYSYTAQPGRIDTMRTGVPAGERYQEFQYAYDAVGNPTRIDDTTTVAGHVRDNRTYRYDALYRLTEADGREAAGNYHHVYTYDGLGNLFDRPEAAGITLTYSGYRLTGSSAGDTFAHGTSGNITELKNWTHRYDAPDG